MTGEWSGDEEDQGWMSNLRDAVEQIEAEVPGFKLVDVCPFDKYQGPYAEVTYQGHEYNVWTDESDDMLWIDGYPLDNTSGPNTTAGLRGTVDFIIEVLLAGKLPDKEPMTQTAFLDYLSDVISRDKDSRVKATGSTPLGLVIGHKDTDWHVVILTTDVHKAVEAATRGEVAKAVKRRPTGTPGTRKGQS